MNMKKRNKKDELTDRKENWMPTRSVGRQAKGKGEINLRTYVVFVCVRERETVCMTGAMFTMLKKKKKEDGWQKK